MKYLDKKHKPILEGMFIVEDGSDQTYLVYKMVGQRLGIFLGSPGGISSRSLGKVSARATREEDGCVPLDTLDLSRWAISI